MANTIYSCVLAEKPKFAVQALVWAWSLIDLAKVSPSQIIVHALSGSCQQTRHSLTKLGIEVVEVEPFHPEHPYCNKLAQLRSPVLQGADCYLLCDSDIAFTTSVEHHISSRRIRAKIVDLPNPPLETWQRIMKKSGLTQPQTEKNDFWQC